MSEKHQDEYSPEEIARRFALGVQRSLSMAHKVQRPLKQKKRGRPRKRKLTPRS